MPVVSIIIPAYNAARFIRRALGSALNQTFKDIEVIVIDDGSQDSTLDVISKVQDDRLVVIRQSNQGQSNARNRGIKLSRGRFITFLDADDYYHPRKVERQLLFLQGRPEFGAVYCRVLQQFPDQPDALFRPSQQYPSGQILGPLLNASLINPNSVLIRREVLDGVGGFTETRYYPEEWDLFLRMAQRGIQFGHLAEELVTVESRPDSNTRMEIQPILKKFAVEVAKRNIELLDPRVRSQFQADRILAMHRFKLAAALVMNSQKREAFGLFRETLAYRPGGTLGLAIAALVPGVLLRPAMKSLWRLNQLRRLRGVEAARSPTVAGRRGPTPRVSVVIPARNEATKIIDCLEQIRMQDYPAQEVEIIVVDGLSDDGTPALAEGLTREWGPASPAVRIVQNPRRDRASGMNVGIQAAQSEILVRIDARTRIRSDYLAKCVDALERTGAANVGGVVRPMAYGKTQEAIGQAMSNRFGVGNAEFRVGKHSGFVSSVYPGCFRKKVLIDLGGFDNASAIVSEDSDMNERIRAAGGKVYLDTGIEVFYEPRETISALWKLYFRYGGARAGNVLKHRRFTAIRQMVPPAFVVGLFLLSILSFVHPIFRILLAGLVLVYGSAVVTVSTLATLGARKPGLFPRLAVIFPTMHFAWALGFLRRLMQGKNPEKTWGN